MPIITELVVEQYGVHLTRHSERLVLTRRGERLQEVPLMHLQAVLIASPGVSISSSAIAGCCEHGIPIHFINEIGDPYAALYSAGLTGTVLTRRAQVAAYDDGRGLALAVAMGQGKVRNQAGLLRYAAKYRKERAPEVHQRLLELADEVEAHIGELQRLASADDSGPPALDETRAQILSAEGRAAKHYWEGVGLLLDNKWQWPGRKGRGAKDIVNCCLNYSYAVLYGQVERALVLAGLDPYAGFLHADRPGKPSMVLDAMEEFRPVAVDRTVLAVLNRDMPIAQDEEGWLDETSRKTLAEAVLKRLSSDTEYEGKRLSLVSVVQSQARHAATFLRGEREAYEAFVQRW
ncbi:MAG: CRISPR-associated endonuclease Cas1 [Anaerolineae bacterium]